MSVKITLKHQGFCDGCDQLIELNTLAQHKRCKLYKKNFLPSESVLIANHGLGTMERLAICKEENEAEVKK